MNPADTISPLRLPPSDADLDDLAALLVDAVDSGAAVSFLADLTHARAIAWWRSALAGLAPRGCCLVARDAEGRIVGSVQCHPAWAPNQPHRGEVVKLLVHRRARARGLGRALMEAVERAALAAGLTLLTLDARRGGAAEALYRRIGWTFVGVIPDYAVDTDGRGLHDTVIFYRQLADARR